MSYLSLECLSSKKAVDSAIKGCEDKVLVLRFGRADDPMCMQLDNMVRQFVVEGNGQFVWLFCVSICLLA